MFNNADIENYLMEQDTYNRRSAKKIKFNDLNGETPDKEQSDKRINNLPILRLETSTARLSMSKSTVLNMFNLEHCVNRLISSLTVITDNVDQKFSRFLDIASTVTESANMLKTMYDDESFDRNDIIECELIALVFGEQ
ncbi:hypothetical protein ALC60_13784 [Trachymyrmex zeteki]|uniref:Uncharacterized protein n=1 Tax=Mycetomoellerius zeteki TaxID=64791 RepID=A0A151WH88_9HYME|nr:hypothetical protein ALC60_13784 [Trachymyrmex zeteki]